MAFAVAGEINSPLRKNLFCDRVQHRLTGSTAFNAVANAFHDFVVLTEWCHGQTAGMAIVLGDDDVLGHIHQTTGQVTASAVFRPCPQTLPRTVRGDEVLQDAQSFLKVGKDGVLNDVLTSSRRRLLRLGHQPTHA